jgi:two-component system sensor histidine kinase KdpD
LRSPLAAIHSLISGVEDASGDVRRELVSGVREEIGYLSHLVDNLLDMSRVEAGALHPHREWHVLEELVEAAIRRLAPSLQQRQLRIELADDLPTLSVDATEMHMVLVNLLDNAVKFSPDGSIISLKAVTRQDMVEMSISNVGQEIASDDLPRIFDRFYRTRLALDSGVPGTGLGLAICKAIIQAHQGKIHVVSSAGETTVHILLPILPQPDDARLSWPNSARGEA